MKGLGSINLGKCSLLRIGKGHPDFTNRVRQGQPPINFKRVTEETDLGVIISEDLKPSKNIAAKANRVLFTIKRTTNFRNKQICTQLCRSLVRPILEYISQCRLFTIFEEGYRRSGERRATKMISADTTLTYEERLKLLDLTNTAWLKEENEET
jgi:hypothetical protein